MSANRFEFIDALRRLRRDAGATPERLGGLPVLMEVFEATTSDEGVQILRDKIAELSAKDERRIAIENVYGFGDAPGKRADDRRNWLIGKQGSPARLAVSLSTLLKRETAAIDWLEEQFLGTVESEDISIAALEQLISQEQPDPGVEITRRSLESMTAELVEKLRDPTTGDAQFHQVVAELVEAQFRMIFTLTDQLKKAKADIQYLELYSPLIIPTATNIGVQGRLLKDIAKYIADDGLKGNKAQKRKIAQGVANAEAGVIELMIAGMASMMSLGDEEDDEPGDEE